MVLKSLLRIISSIFIIFLISSVIVATSGYWYLTHTPQGARWLFEHAVKRYLNCQAITYEHLEGTIADGIRLSNVQITDLSIFIEHHVILIQNLELAIPGFDARQIRMKIENGRIKFPLSDPIGFYGTLSRGTLDINVYAGIIDAREIVTVFKNDLSLKNLRGTASNASLIVSGPWTHPVLKGDFFLEDFRYLGFSLHELPASFDLDVSRDQGAIVWKGTLWVPSGTVVSRLTTVNLQESKLIFQGAFRNPALDIKGSSKVEQTIINIALKGTKQKPELHLTSNPPRAQNVLLLMLATGQEVMLPGKVLGGDQLSSDSVRDFVDYFTFASDGGRFAENVGLSNFSVHMDDYTRGLGIKKRLNEQLKLGVNVQETRDPTGESTNVRRTVGGEVQVLDNVTVGVDQTVSQSSDQTTIQTPPQQHDPETDVMIKYKKNF